MSAVLAVFLTGIRDVVRRRADLELEVLALQHQVLVLQLSLPKTPSAWFRAVLRRSYR